MVQNIGPQLKTLLSSKTLNTIFLKEQSKAFAAFRNFSSYRKKTLLLFNFFNVVLLSVTSGLQGRCCPPAG